MSDEACVASLCAGCVEAGRRANQPAPVLAGFHDTYRRGFLNRFGADGFRAATCFAAMPVLREVLDHRLILHAFGVDLRPSGARVLVGRVTGGFRAATFFAMTIVSREALDHRLMAPHGLRRGPPPRGMMHDWLRYRWFSRRHILHDDDRVP